PSAHSHWQTPWSARLYPPGLLEGVCRSDGADGPAGTVSRTRPEAKIVQTHEGYDDDRTRDTGGPSRHTADPRACAARAPRTARHRPWCSLGSCDGAGDRPRGSRQRGAPDHGRGEVARRSSRHGTAGTAGPTACPRPRGPPRHLSPEWACPP